MTLVVYGFATKVQPSVSPFYFVNEQGWPLQSLQLVSVLELYKPPRRQERNGSPSHELVQYGASPASRNSVSNSIVMAPDSALCRQVQALQFEWAWQHPLTSTIVRDVYKSVSKAKTVGLSGKVQL